MMQGVACGCKRVESAALGARCDGARGSRQKLRSRVRPTGDRGFVPFRPQFHPRTETPGMSSALPRFSTMMGLRAGNLHAGVGCRLQRSRRGGRCLAVRRAGAGRRTIHVRRSVLVDHAVAARHAVLLRRRNVSGMRLDVMASGSAEGHAAAPAARILLSARATHQETRAE